MFEETSLTLRMKLERHQKSYWSIVSQRLSLIMKHFPGQNLTCIFGKQDQNLKEILYLKKMML